MFRGKNKSEKVVDSLLKTGRVRKAAREFLAYGTLEDELRPLNPLKTVEFSWERKPKGKKAAKKIAAFSSTMPAVVGTVWKNHDGRRRAVVAANVSGEDCTVKFKLPEGAESLSAVPVEGEGKARFTIADGTVELVLSSREIAVLATP
jgi:hypothetical protein